jgi:hypothetical protein
MGLHLGWIPNEPGLRAREYAAPAPGVPDPDSPEAARLRAAHAARALWTRLLIVVGLLALALFGLVGTVSHAHRSWFWAVGVVLAVCCWLPLLEFAVRRRRVASRRRRESEEREVRHAAEVAEYQRGKAAWQHAEAERIAAAPRWLQVAAHEDITRLDVFGGTPQGRQSLLAGVGQTLLAERAVIVLDLSQDQVAAELIAAARQAGISCQDYQLPRDLPATPLLAGLSGDEIASLIVEVLHADDANATAAGRATDLMILRKITRALGGDVTMSRLHEALSFLLADATNATTAAGRPLTAAPQLSLAEQDGLHGLFGTSMRGEIGGNLIRLAAVLEPLAELGADDARANADAAAAPRRPARLTCLSLPDGARDVAADLAAALIVQWATRSVADTDGFRPAVVLAGADEQSTRHLSRLTTVCERYEVPLVRMFSRLTEESSRHLDSRHTAFMRLATRPEALRAAEHIGLERKFIAGRFSHRQSVSQSRTKTSTESTTHTTGRAEGEATTHTTGTTTGEMYSEAKVPRHDNQIHIHANGNGGGGSGSGSDESDSREQFRARVAREREAAAAKSDRGSGRQPSGGGSKRDRGSSGGGGGGGARVSTSSGGKPAMDTIKTRTRFSAQHTSDAKTQSVTNTEETSHTRSESRSRTEGASVGDEITFELVYDHTVQPETLMALPENQMLAPHVVAGAPNAASLPGTPGGAAMPGGAATRVSAVAARPAGPESRMVALVIDPAVVGTDAVAPVSPHEIPAYEPPAPAVSSHVPDYERVPHAALGPGEPTRSR